MKLAFSVTFKQGQETVATVVGQREVDTADISVADMSEGVADAEELLEKLLGLRVHILQTN